MRRRNRAVAVSGVVVMLAAAGLFAAPSDGEAAVVICKKGKRLRLRETACKAAEQAIPASELGVVGPPGTDGAAGEFSGVLPSGQTLRGTFNMGGDSVAGNSLANTSISFLFTLDAAPTAHVVLTGNAPPPECPGSAALPEAQPGHVCIYENTAKLNTTGVVVDQAGRAGVTIFIVGTGAGRFYASGTWALTAP